MDVLEVGMKLATFLGVLLAAAAMHAQRERPRASLRSALLGLAGVALMVANAWLATAPALGLAVDAGYLAACVRALVGALRSAGPVEFHVVARAP